MGCLYVRAVRSSILSAALILVPPSARAGAVTDLGVLPNATTSIAYGINGAGQVVGESFNSRARPRAFLWENGRMRELPLLPGHTMAVALAINDAGRAVGWSGAQGVQRAVMWDGDTVMDLGVLPGQTHSYATDINNLGQVAGWSGTIVGYVATGHSFRWRNGEMTDLPPPPDYPDSRAEAINDLGFVVGAVGNMDGGLSLAALWEEDEPRVIHGPLSVAKDVGMPRPRLGKTVLEVVGWYEFLYPRAFLWERATDDKGNVTTSKIELGTLGGHSSMAFAINVHGVVVGTADTRGEMGEPSGPAHAFRWARTEISPGAMADLNTPETQAAGWLLREAAGINSAGLIVGTGPAGIRWEDGQPAGPYYEEHGFLLGGAGLRLKPSLDWALRIVGGLRDMDAANMDAFDLDASSSGRITLPDAVKLLRKATGIDP